MKNRLLILVIAILFICIGMSGCEDDFTIDNGKLEIENMILGSWRGIELTTKIDGKITTDNITNRSEIFTFYDNGTIKTETNGSISMWLEYEIKYYDMIGDYVIMARGGPADETFLLYFNISKDGKYLTITIYLGNDKYITRYVKEE